MLPMGSADFANFGPIIEVWEVSGSLPSSKHSAVEDNFERRGVFLEPFIGFVVSICS